MRLAALIGVLGLAWNAAAEEPPRALSCLSRWYAVRPVRTKDGWVGVLPDGRQVPFDAGRRSQEEMLESPAIRDLYSPRYERGSWKPVTDQNYDPGRARIDAIFQATYGDSLEAVTQQTFALDFFGVSVRVHSKAAEAFRRVIARLTALSKKDSSLVGFLQKTAGTLVWRKIAGTDRVSAHAYGIAIDLNPARSHYWRWTKQPLTGGDIPAAIVDAFEGEGFIWGGRWYHFDTMHFEWRPELLDPACVD